MGRIDKTVFISYRRASAPWALAIFQDLTHHGYDVFFDFNGIASGDFESAIIENINARAHFLVLLTPTALDRCSDTDDWLRREIETALESKRNIIPLLLDNFDFANPEISNQLSGKIASLRRFNALPVPVAYFAEAMNRLRERYLNVSVETVLQPASIAAQRTAEAARADAVIRPGNYKESRVIKADPTDRQRDIRSVPAGSLRLSDSPIAQQLQGAWTETVTASRFYARLVNGQLLIPYCFQGNSGLTGHIKDLGLYADTLRGYFEWLEVPLNGAILLNLSSVRSSHSEDVLQGGWWFSQHLNQWPDHELVTMDTPKMFPLNLQRVRDTRCPEWAEHYFRTALQPKRRPVY